jgi:hypothetical protein
MYNCCLFKLIKKHKLRHNENNMAFPLIAMTAMMFTIGPAAAAGDVAPAPPTQLSNQQKFCTMVVAVAADATQAEREAAAELAALAGKLCGGTPLTVTTPAAAKAKAQLAVGVGAATAIGLAPGDLSFAVLGTEGFVASSNRTAGLLSSGSYALSGAPNSTSGTLYACYHLLRAFGVRFLAWDHTLLPATLPSPLPVLDRTFVPTFEYRDIDGWASLSHPQQAKYFHMNGAAQASSSLSSSLAAPALTSPGATDRAFGAAREGSPYASPPGFVHTSYALFAGDTDGKKNCTTGQCPPADMFKQHNEWFYPHNDPSVCDSQPNCICCILVCRRRRRPPPPPPPCCAAVLPAAALSLLISRLVDQTGSSAGPTNR